MMGLLVCYTPDREAHVFLVLDDFGLPVCIEANLCEAYYAVLDRGETEVVYYTPRGPEVYRIIADDPDRSPQDGGAFSCVRVLNPELDDVPDIPTLGFFECPEDAIGPQSAEPPTPKRRRRKPR